MNTQAGSPELRVRRLGLRPYRDTLARMQAFNAARRADTADEIWLLQHLPVYTLGQAARREHLLAPGNIDVQQSDRGGQVTYHGPGQIVVYTLLDLARRRLGVRAAVRLLEQAVIDALAVLGIDGSRRDGAPGVYVGEAKIAALGLRVRQGRCYHGIALNVDVDLEPFARIDPCGYPGLAVTRVVDLAPGAGTDEVADTLLAALVAALGCAGTEVKQGTAEWSPATALAG